MNRYCAGLLAFTLTSVAALAAANAADMYAGGPGGYKDGPYPVWSGFYVGAHAGMSDTQDKVHDVDGLNGGARFHVGQTGPIGGGTVGYNWQGALGSNALVLGVEADIGGISIQRQRFDPNFPGGTFAGVDGGLYGDVTGRVGVALGSSLVYGKAGFAFFDGDAFVDNSKGGFGGGRAFTPDTFTGWVAGGGAEIPLNPVWSVKAEYLHFDFGTQNATLIATGGPVGAHFRYSNDLTADTFSVGVNYHLGAGYTPLK